MFQPIVSPSILSTLRRGDTGSVALPLAVNQLNMLHFISNTQPKATFHQHTSFAKYLHFLKSSTIYPSKSHISRASKFELFDLLNLKILVLDAYRCFVPVQVIVPVSQKKRPRTNLLKRNVAVTWPANTLAYSGHDLVLLHGFQVIFRRLLSRFRLLKFLSDRNGE